MSIEKIKEFMAWARINVIKHNFELEVKVQGNIQVMRLCKASSYGLVIHPCAKWYVYIKPHTVMKFTSFGLLPLHMLHMTNLVKIGPVDSEENMLTDVNP